MGGGDRARAVVVGGGYGVETGRQRGTTEEEKLGERRVNMIRGFFCNGWAVDLDSFSPLEKKSKN